MADPSMSTRGVAFVEGLFAPIHLVYNSLVMDENEYISTFYMPAYHSSDATTSFFKQSCGFTHTQKFIGKVSVTINYSGYLRHADIKDFDPESARNATICMDDLGKVAIERYIQKTDTPFPCAIYSAKHRV